MKKQLLFQTIIFTVVLIFALPSTSFAWGPDVIVNPVSGRYYSKAKVSVAYDGSIYYSRLYSSVSISAPMKSWEVLKSVDNGTTFTYYKGGSLSSGSSAKYTDLEILAAGNDSATFNLFLARIYKDTVNSDSRLIAEKYNSLGTKSTLFNELYAYTTIRGWGSISMASDYREKNEYSSPYSFSIAVVKPGPYDSIIVWTDNTGGTDLKRIGLTATSSYFRNVSIAVGASSSSGYGRLGVTWDVYSSSNASYGRLRAMFISPDAGINILHSGPYIIGDEIAKYREPVIAMSQKTNGTLIAPGNHDIRTIIFYEHNDGSINGFLTDTIMNEAPSFQHHFEVASSATANTQVHAIYSPFTEEFLITYYNQTNKTLSFSTKSLLSPADENSIVVESNYRDVSTVSTVAVKPRVDINKTSKKFVFAWNDSGASLLESHISSVSIDEVSSESVSNLLLYPNPATDHVNIAFNSLSEQKIQVAVYDLSGKVVYSSESQVMQGENLINVNTNNLAEGQYVLMVSSSNNNYPIKLLVTK